MVTGANIDSFFINAPIEITGSGIIGTVQVNEEGSGAVLYFEPGKIVKEKDEVKVTIIKPQTVDKGGNSSGSGRSSGNSGGSGGSGGENKPIPLKDMTVTVTPEDTEIFTGVKNSIDIDVNVPDVIVTYSSSNPDIVSVDSKTGQYVGIKPGKASITVKVSKDGYNTFTDTFEVEAKYKYGYNFTEIPIQAVEGKMGKLNKDYQLIYEDGEIASEPYFYSVTEEMIKTYEINDLCPDIDVNLLNEAVLLPVEVYKNGVLVKDLDKVQLFAYVSYNNSESFYDITKSSNIQLRDLVNVSIKNKRKAKPRFEILSYPILFAAEDQGSLSLSSLTK